MSMKQVNKAIAMTKALAKKSTKLVGVAIPVATVVANLADIAEKSGGNLNEGAKMFVRRYSGINMNDGTFNLGDAAIGSGALILGAVVGKVVSALA